MKRYEMILLACVLILLALAMSGCETVPVIVTVDKRQNYTMPSEFWIHGLGGLTMDEIAEKCEGNINGCLIRLTDDDFVIYYRTHNVAEHEFDHVVFGPKHNKEKR